MRIVCRYLYFITKKKIGQNQHPESKKILLPLSMFCSGLCSHQYCTSICKPTCIGLQNILEVNQYKSMPYSPLVHHIFQSWPNAKLLTLQISRLHNSY